MKGKTPLPKRYIMGLDGGGTKTVCAIADTDGNIIGYGRGGPANTHFVKWEIGISSFDKAIQETLVSANLGAKPALDAICIGSPTPKDVYLPVLEKQIVFRGSLITAGEARAALASAHTQPWGLVIVAGTGSFAWLKTRDGREHIIGGWGALLGDEGSAYWIGREGIKAAIRAHDHRGPETTLTQAIMDVLELSDLRQLIWEVYRGNLKYRHQVAALSPVVAAEAAEGDIVARDILHRAAYELSLLATSCATALNAQHEVLPCVLSGGVFAAEELIIKPLEAFLQESLPNVTILPNRAPQIVGSCAIALSELGIKLTDALLSKLQCEIEKAQSQYSANHSH